MTTQKNIAYLTPSNQAGAAELALPGRRRSGPLGGQRITQSEKRGGWFV